MSPDEAEVGYYKAKTWQDVVVELAATEHAGMYQHTFLEPGVNVFIDIPHRLASYTRFDPEQKFEGGNINVEPDGRYEGSGTYSNGYNMAPPWTIYINTLNLMHRF
jgi:Glycosyl hydrolase family 92 N-terminal domain